MPRKVKTNIYLTRKQMDALKKITKETEVPMAALIRRGVDWVIEQHFKQHR